MSLRCPTDGRRYGFLSRTLLFGAAAAVLRYNCFSRILAVLANRIFGLPLMNYSGDVGCLITDFYSRPAVRVFTSFCRALGIKLKRKKTDVGRRITFLGMDGFFPGRDNGKTPSVDLADSENRKWAERIPDVIEAGAISHNELEPSPAVCLSRKLPFSDVTVVL